MLSVSNVLLPRLYTKLLVQAALELPGKIYHCFLTVNANKSDQMHRYTQRRYTDRVVVQEPTDRSGRVVVCLAQ